MSDITKEQYEFALAKVEELLPLVDDNTPANDKSAVELTLMSDIIREYENKHFPINKPSLSDILEYAIEESGLTKKELACEIGVSSSRISDFLSGRSVPSLKIAGRLCKKLNISPALMLGV